MKRLFVSSDLQNVSVVRDDYFDQLYYSKDYSDSKFDHVLFLLCDIDLMTVPNVAREKLQNAIDFMETPDE